jgi:hypothetical protein
MSSIGRVGNNTSINQIESSTETSTRTSRPISLYNNSSYDTATSSTSQNDGLAADTDPNLVAIYGRYASTVSKQNEASDIINQLNADKMADGLEPLPTMNPPLFHHPLNTFYQDMASQPSEKAAMYSKLATPIAGMMSNPAAPQFNPNDLNSAGSQAWLGALTTAAQDQYNMTGTMPTEADITKVLQAGVAQADEDVANLAKTVHDHQVFKSAMQATQIDIMTELKNREDPNYQPQSIQVPVFDDNGNFANEYQTISSTEDLTKAQADLGNRIQTYTEMSQLDQLDLQNAMQAQQRAYQMLSDIIKMMHDTAKAIIGNIRA